MSLIGEPHTAAEFDEIEKRIRCALHDAICDHSIPLQRFYREELAELSLLREATIPTPRQP